MGVFDRLVEGRPGAGEVSYEPSTARVVKVDEQSQVWAVPLDGDMRHPVGPCRGARASVVGDVVLLLFDAEGEPWAIEDRAAQADAARTPDTGARALDAAPGVTAIVHRAGQVVTLAVAGNAENPNVLDVVTLPPGWRPLATTAVPAVHPDTGESVGHLQVDAAGTVVLHAAGPAAASVTFTTLDAWPTSLPPAV